MTQVWLITEVNYLQSKNVDIIEDFVIPTIEEFKSDLITYHFLHEGHLLLRLKGDEEVITKSIKPYVSGLLRRLGLTTIGFNVDYNYDETAGFGEGSDLAIELLGLATRMFLFYRKAKKSKLKLGNKYDPIYFSHLFLKHMGLRFLWRSITSLPRINRSIVSRIFFAQWSRH